MFDQVVCVLSPSNENSDKQSELKILISELRTVSMVNEFAKYARIERRINKLNDELRASCM
jgi:CHD5-like protein